MTAAELVTVAFLAVSIVSLIVQAWAMRRLHRTRVRDGVYRTALCRVGCAVIYVAVGANALVWHWATLQTTFSAFCITQGTWQANAWLDVRARAHHTGRHRYSGHQPLRERHDPRTPDAAVTTFPGLDAGQIHVAARMVQACVDEHLPKRAAVIILETGIVESGLHIYANSNVPDSMALPHELVGNDHASVGPLQQQVPSWGRAVDCMDPYQSAVKFLRGAGNNPGLLTLPGYRFEYVGYPGASSWTQIPTGSAAQAVQVSAFPDRYQKLEAVATQLADVLWPTANVQEDEMRIVKNKTRQAFPLLVGAGPKPVVLNKAERAKALVAAGVPQSSIDDADYNVLRAWA